MNELTKRRTGSQIFQEHYQKTLRMYVVGLNTQISNHEVDVVSPCLTDIAD